MFCRLVTMLVAFLLAQPAFAEAGHLVIDQSDSTLTFTAMVNNAPSVGSFRRFDADIWFDPENLPESKATVTVDLASVQSAYEEVARQLQTKPWFNIAQFPQATFTSRQFIHRGGKDYLVKGALTLRGITLPAEATFTLERFDEKGAKIKGSSMVRRLMFGVGQGQWKDTSTVKDSVLVEFHVTAHKK